MPPRNAPSKSKKSKRANPSPPSQSPAPPSAPPLPPALPGHPTDPSDSPPAQLPTPLPDPPLISPPGQTGHEPSPTLIDLDAGTPSPPSVGGGPFAAGVAGQGKGYEHAEEEDEDEFIGGGGGAGYSSPAFREVVLSLPEEDEHEHELSGGGAGGGGALGHGQAGGSPPPLPVPPRRGSVRRADGGASGRGGEDERSTNPASSSATSTSTTSPSASTISDSLSRTVRGGYPYAPRGAGTTSPPLVSRPVVGGVGVGGMSVGRALFGDQHGYDAGMQQHQHQHQPPQQELRLGSPRYGYAQGYGVPPVEVYQGYDQQYNQHQRHPSQRQEEYHESPFELDEEHEGTYVHGAPYQGQTAYYGQPQPQPQHHQQHQRGGSIPMPTRTAQRSHHQQQQQQQHQAQPHQQSIPVPIPASISPSSPSSSTSPRSPYGLNSYTSAGSGLAQAMRRGAAAAGAAAAASGSIIMGHTRSGSGAGSGAGGHSAGVGVGGHPGAAGARGQTRDGKDGKSGETESVVSWARWDVLNGKRVLLVAYASSESDALPSSASHPVSGGGGGGGGGARLQMWDTSNLGSVTELLDIAFDRGELGMALGGGGGGASGSTMGLRVAHAAVLPEVKGGRGTKEAFEGSRPLLGILTENADEDELELGEPRSTFVIYSLRTHQVVKLLSFAGRAHMFVPGSEVIAVSTTLPPTLHILSARTFHTLHTVLASSLDAHATPAPSSASTGGALHTYSPALNSTINTLNAFVPSSAISISHAISQSASTHISNIHNTVSGASSNSNKSVSLPGLSIDGHAPSSSSSPNYHDNTTKTNINTQSGSSGGSSPVDRRPAPVHPVFALHGRLLAYASPSPAAQQQHQQNASPSLLGAGASTKAARRLSSSSSAGSHVSSPSLSSSPFGLSKLSAITQADVGHAALKVGESVFSGMRFLGGKALEAAKSRVAAPASSSPAPEGRLGAYSPGGVGVSPGSAGGGGGMAISRSAPDDSGLEEARERLRKERRYSNSTVHEYSGPASPLTTQTLTVAPHTRSAAEAGHYVTVLDLAGLIAGERKKTAGREDGREGETVTGGGGAPRKIDEFLVSRSQRVVDLKFAADGTGAAAVLKNGHTVRAFKLHPMPSVALAARASSSDVSEGSATVETAARKASQVYELHRGRTNAVVESMEWAKDGRWFGIATRNRTVHVFGVNPYGGKPDIRSHLEGRVRNVEVMEAPLTTLAPLVRLRGLKNPTADATTAPLSFAFLTPSDLTPSPELQFPFTTPSINITNSPSFSPPKRKRGTNYQDVLVFDPADGVLSLRRLTLEKRVVREQGVVQAVTSISLPGMGGAGRLSSSPSTRGSAATSKPVEQQVELIARENVQATWALRHGRAGAEIKTAIQARVPESRERRHHGASADWLAQGEITTCSSSRRILPRSLYLSHQFSFHSLGEDYHALIRRYQFDISGAVIEVRKAVEISAYSSGGGESFVEGFSSPRDIRRASSSFDEPIASAISGSFDSSNLPVILPMYPNGVPGATKPKSFRNSIPIRTMAGIGDGVSEGIGRLRREMTKARSPQLVARSDSSMSGPVPLEFDEEDEDFLQRDSFDADPNDDHPFAMTPEIQRNNPSTQSDSTSHLIAPSQSSTQHLMDADVVGSMEEDIGFSGWEPQDRLAVEEAEQYDDITAVGFVEDEPKYQPPVDIPAAPKRKSKKRR